MTHDVVQDGVDGGRDVVTDSSGEEQVLVDGVVVANAGAVDEKEPLEVERRPAHEERYDHRSCGQVTLE